MPFNVASKRVFGHENETLRADQLSCNPFACDFTGSPPRCSRQFMTERYVKWSTPWLSREFEMLVFGMTAKGAATTGTTVKTCCRTICPCRDGASSPVIPSKVGNGAAAGPRHGREGRRLSEREVSESNSVALSPVAPRDSSNTLRSARNNRI